MWIIVEGNWARVDPILCESMTQIQYIVLSYVHRLTAKQTQLLSGVPVVLDFAKAMEFFFELDSGVTT